jgi:hypothetical protein
MLSCACYGGKTPSGYKGNERAPFPEPQSAASAPFSCHTSAACHGWLSPQTISILTSITTTKSCTSCTCLLSVRGPCSCQKKSRHEVVPEARNYRHMPVTCRSDHLHPSAPHSAYYENGHQPRPRHPIMLLYNPHSAGYLVRPWRK